MSGLVYGGWFEDVINALCSRKNIAALAMRFKELNKSHGPYAFGDFAKMMLPKSSAKEAKVAMDSWEKNVQGIPADLRQQLTDLITANLKSRRPLPMFLKVSSNVDQSHQLIAKTFVYDDAIFIGVLMLCPNPKYPA